MPHIHACNLSESNSGGNTLQRSSLEHKRFRMEYDGIKVDSHSEHGTNVLASTGNSGELAGVQMTYETTICLVHPCSPIVQPFLWSLSLTSSCFTIWNQQHQWKLKDGIAGSPRRNDLLQAISAHRVKPFRWTPMEICGDMTPTRKEISLQSDNGLPLIHVACLPARNSKVIPNFGT